MKTNLILSMVITGLIISSVASARPFAISPEERFEHLLQKLELSKDQQKQAESILTKLKQEVLEDENEPPFHALRALNPGEADYLEQTSQVIDQFAEQKRRDMMAIAIAKQSLYKLLDDQQKEKFMKMSERRPDIPKGMKDHRKCEK